MKNILITLLILLSFTSKAQQLPTYDSLGNVTYYTEDTIKLPFSVAKKVTRELVSCDSAKAILELTKEQLSLTENKVILKDSIISNHVKKEDVYKQVITNQDQKFELQGQWVTELKSQNRKLKAKLTFMQVATTIFVAVLTYIYVRK
jgi:CRISPR/Cas system CMR subunit Cmr4 (Cas7 group RAMP superfamily)